MSNVNSPYAFSTVWKDHGGGVWGSAPSDTMLSGTFDEGNTMTITGSGFGTAGVPLQYDDFESSSVDDDLSTLGWDTREANSPNPTDKKPFVTNDQFYSGTQSGKADMSTGGDCAATLASLNLTEIYCSYFYRTVKDNGTPTTVKGWRVHSDNLNEFTSYPLMAGQELVDAYSGNNFRYTIQTLDTAADGPNSVSIGVSGGGIAESVWMRREHYVKISTPGVADGIITYDEDLVRRFDEPAIVTRETGITEVIERMLLPFYWGNGGGGFNWYDNVLVCATRARVEVGDNAIYANCTKREPMNTLTRVDGQIEFKVPSNTFTSSSTVFVYVIDTDGNPGVSLSTVVA